MPYVCNSYFPLTLTIMHSIPSHANPNRYQLKALLTPAQLEEASSFSVHKATLIAPQTPSARTTSQWNAAQTPQPAHCACPASHPLGGASIGEGLALSVCCSSRRWLVRSSSRPASGCALCKGKRLCSGVCRSWERENAWLCLCDGVRW